MLGLAELVDLPREATEELTKCRDYYPVQAKSFNDWLGDRVEMQYEYVRYHVH